MKTSIITLLVAAALIATGCASATGTTTNNPNADTTFYTLDDVSQHNSRSDCWMVIDGSVYDVTSYIAQHPGRERILEGCGIDATSLYSGGGGFNHLHNAMAKAALTRLQIGALQ